MFFHKKKPQTLSYDTENKRPVLKCSICNGEQVAGFRDKDTGRFEEILYIRKPSDLDAFKAEYGIEDEIRKIY